MDGITQAAGRQLKADLEQRNASPDQCLRYHVDSEGTERLMLDLRHPSDEAFEYNGRTVLVVDAKSFVTLAGRTLDYKDGNFCLV